MRSIIAQAIRRVVVNTYAWRLLVVANAGYPATPDIERVVAILNRRHFLQSLAIAATPSIAFTTEAPASPLGPLLADPNRILDLPKGFSYQIVSQAGNPMSDGLRVPGAADGMGAFAGEDGRIILVCNHELEHGKTEHGPFAEGAPLPDFVADKIYDAGSGKTPMTGGTTTIIYNPATGKTEKQFLSLVGTEVNCAGGTTPWGSWLSCEECFNHAGVRGAVHRDKPHGYVFEVPASATGLVKAEPIRAMGRLEHEAAAVDPGTGIVYLTEDKHQSLFYRYIPDVPGELIKGGRLQALAIVGQPSMQTHNWSNNPDIVVGQSLPVSWIDLDDVDNEDNDLRVRGARKGAATFARGEGLCVADGYFAFSCTIGGPTRLGQVFAYEPSPFEGTARESEAHGQLRLVAEADSESLLRNADNITAAPWGGLVVCEDTAGHCGIVGIGPDGAQYAVADNAYSDSELAGACFSPDGDTLFVNIQYPGLTLAITGPWPDA
jgi:secreted PhoX family phosphatase